MFYQGEDALTVIDSSVAPSPGGPLPGQWGELGLSPGGPLPGQWGELGLIL